MEHTGQKQVIWKFTELYIGGEGNKIYIHIIHLLHNITFTKIIYLYL